jgi:hypothetical protein
MATPPGLQWPLPLWHTEKVFTEKNLREEKLQPTTTASRPGWPTTSTPSTTTSGPTSSTNSRAENIADTVIDEAAGQTIARYQSGHIDSPRGYLMTVARDWYQQRTGRRQATFDRAAIDVLTQTFAATAEEEIPT